RQAAREATEVRDNCRQIADSILKSTLPHDIRCTTFVPMQASLFSGEMRRELARTEHGGAVRRHRRKLERPVSTRRPMHVVLSSRHARGGWNLKRHDRAVRDALRDMARRFGVRIYDFANVGSHLHLLL